MIYWWIKANDEKFCRGKSARKYSTSMLQCFFFFFLYNSSSSNNTLRSSRGQENVHNSVWNRAKSSALRTLTYNFFTLSHFRPLADCSWPLGTAITRSKSVYYNRINIYTTLLDIALNSNYKIPTAGNVKKGECRW